jgi:hypothetical protein
MIDVDRLFRLWCWYVVVGCLLKKSVAFFAVRRYDFSCALEFWSQNFWMWLARRLEKCRVLNSEDNIFFIIFFLKRERLEASSRYLSSTLQRNNILKNSHCQSQHTIVIRCTTYYLSRPHQKQKENNNWPNFYYRTSFVVEGYRTFLYDVVRGF